MDASCKLPIFYAISVPRPSTCLLIPLDRPLACGAEIAGPSGPGFIFFPGVVFRIQRIGGSVELSMEPRDVSYKTGQVLFYGSIPEAGKTAGSVERGASVAGDPAIFLREDRFLDISRSCGVLGMKTA